MGKHYEQLTPEERAAIMMMKESEQLLGATDRLGAAPLSFDHHP